jgi:hypothetical protein
MRASQMSFNDEVLLYSGAALVIFLFWLSRQNAANLTASVIQGVASTAGNIAAGAVTGAGNVAQGVGQGIGIVDTNGNPTGPLSQPVPILSNVLNWLISPSVTPATAPSTSTSTTFNDFGITRPQTW